VTSSVFPSDEKTRQFLKAQGRGEAFVALSADDDADYERVIDIDLSALEPMAACPHSPGNVRTVADLAGMKVDQVCVGSCTNASYRDIMTVAAALKGRRIAPELSLGVACGSRQVQTMVARNGALGDIVAAGARILENACGFCIGNSMAPRTDAVSLRTSNRNFFGRSGTSSAQVYLVSPETAVAAALAGKIVDPREFFSGVAHPDTQVPETFEIDDTMIAEPALGEGKVSRGPNIGDPPSSDPCPDTIRGVAAIKVGDKITTDHIMPAGNRLKYRSNIPAYAEYVFEREAPGFACEARANRDKGLHNVIVAGESYGQGSSREHAAICPMFLGVKLVVARSVERIHKANLVNFGIVPALFANASDYEQNIDKGDVLVVEGVRDAVAGGGALTLRNDTKGVDIPLILDLSERERRNLLAGGLINATRESA
jgi:aconitate hydratase